MAHTHMKLEDQLVALTAAVECNRQLLELTKDLVERHAMAMVSALTALTISITEIIETEPDRHSSPASEGRAEELYKLSVQQRRAAAAQADAELPAGTRSIASVGLG